MAVLSLNALGTLREPPILAVRDTQEEPNDQRGLKEDEIHDGGMDWKGRRLCSLQVDTPQVSG